MRLITYQSATGPRAAVAHSSGGYVDLHNYNSSLPTCMTQWLENQAELSSLTAEAAEQGEPMTQELELLAPIPSPSKIICVGLNYADHARETGKEIPAEPVIFNKFPSAVNAHGKPILLPKLSEKVDYEAELVVVIGTGGKHIAEANAMQHVAGYACGHDVSARDWQLHKPGGQWLLGKTFDTFATFGPELVTVEEVGNPSNLRIALRLNGTTMQDSTTAQLIFSVEKLIAYISSVCTLAAGDVIFTGTPPGVGAARKPPVYLSDGDVAEVEIERIGVLSNPVVKER